MSRVFYASVLSLLVMVGARAQSTRIASDFEIQQMERQAANAKDFLSQLSAHLNLGDVRTTRNENAIASAEYRKALEIAVRERTESRKAGNLTRYATATMYEGLAAAKLGRDGLAFDSLEEAVRYTSDDATSWNLYATAMQLVGHAQKAVSASRNAVAIAAAEERQSPSMANALDLGIYQYSLARSLRETGSRADAAALLEAVVKSLRSPRFENLREEVARSESFEIYSSARGDASAYISLLNRSQLLLGSLYEQRGELARAREMYEAVLAARSDDPAALAGRARLARSEEERARSFAEAFDANPFAIDTIREYQRWLQTAKPGPNEGSSAGARIRRALEQMAAGEHRAARATIDALIAKYPSNDVLQYLAASNDVSMGDVEQARSRPIHVDSLRAEIERRLTAPGQIPAFLVTPVSDVSPSAVQLQALIALLAQNRLTAEQRVALDRTTFMSSVVFSSGPAAAAAQTIFESGAVDGVPFRFSEPTAFAGAFPAGVPLRLTYHILGATELNGADALLLEPLKLEVPR